jgi:hypothetical protein
MLENFKKYAYLDQNESILFYDNMDEQTWQSLQRNQFVELDVNFRFSKMDNLISSFSNFIPLLGQLDPGMLDDDSKKALYCEFH